MFVTIACCNLYLALLCKLIVVLPGHQKMNTLNIFNAIRLTLVMQQVKTVFSDPWNMLRTKPPRRHFRPDGQMASQLTAVCPYPSVINVPIFNDLSRLVGQNKPC